MKAKYLFSISCRSVGPGGTDVSFYATPEGMKAIWTNENCPYDCICDDINEETSEAADGHNVSFVSWETITKAIAYRPEKPEPGKPLNPQPKKVLNKKKNR